MTKSAELRVAISDQLKQRLQHHCELLGISESDYLRSLLIANLKLHYQPRQRPES